MPHYGAFGTHVKNHKEMIHILSIFFPKTCGFCNKIGKSYICEKCRKEIETSSFFLNKIEDYTQDSNKYFDYHCYLFSYDSIIREKILQYKFHNQAYLFRMFSELFIKNVKVCRFLKSSYDIIMPVPMTKKKIKQRGYNQSELIARYIAKNTETLELNTKTLIKFKENKTQSSLNKTQRTQNVKNVYKIQNIQTIKEKSILLFDDIYTTGATCNECAKKLKQAGCKKVSILTIAKDFKEK